MERYELFSACRWGNLEKVKFLVEEREVEVNVRDVWDSTPLYYACLCGHTELVEYLLEQGARCDPDTFDGERCLYGALTREIRQLLIEHNQISAKTMRRDPYEEFLRQLLIGHFSDVTFVIHGEDFNLHRCILSARSTYFLDNFCSKWRGRRNIRRDNLMLAFEAFKAVMDYLYTGSMEIHVSLVEDCVRLARLFKLDELEDRLRSQQSDATFFTHTKYATRISSLVIEPMMGNYELHDSLGMLAQQALPDESLVPFDRKRRLSPDEIDKHRSLCDVVFVVDGFEFYCHKVFFAGRSEYFRALLRDHFDEITSSSPEPGDSPIPRVKMYQVSPQAFATVVYFVYQDSVEIPPEIVIEVLFIAEIYLLPGLKKLCGNVLAENLDDASVIDMLVTARTLQLPRLESSCVKFIADNLEEIVRMDAFRNLVIDDANQVKNRHETDTIDIIDDIRYCINGNVQTTSQMEEAHDKNKLIDELLEELGLDA